MLDGPVSSVSAVSGPLSAAEILQVLRRLPPPEIERLRLLFERLESQRQLRSRLAGQQACLPLARQTTDGDRGLWRELAARMFPEPSE